MPTVKLGVGWRFSWTRDTSNKNSLRIHVNYMDAIASMKESKISKKWDKLTDIHPRNAFLTTYKYGLEILWLFDDNDKGKSQWFKGCVPWIKIDGVQIDVPPGVNLIRFIKERWNPDPEMIALEKSTTARAPKGVTVKRETTYSTDLLVDTALTYNVLLEHGMTIDDLPPNLPLHKCLVKIKMVAAETLRDSQMYYDFMDSVVEALRSNTSMRGQNPSAISNILAVEMPAVSKFMLSRRFLPEPNIS